MSDDDKELKRYKRDVEYLEAHYSELLQSHPDQWIAIYDRKGRRYLSRFDQLLDQIQSAGISPGVTLTEYLSTQEEVLILISGYFSPPLGRKRPLITASLEFPQAGRRDPSLA